MNSKYLLIEGENKRFSIYTIYVYITQAINLL